jgi:hypothetical protein
MSPNLKTLEWVIGSFFWPHCTLYRRQASELFSTTFYTRSVFQPKGLNYIESLVVVGPLQIWGGGVWWDQIEVFWGSEEVIEALSKITSVGKRVNVTIRRWGDYVGSYKKNI